MKEEIIIDYLEDNLVGEELEKVEQLIQENPEVREAILGAEHKDLVPVLNNYALMLEKMGRSEEAVSIRERAQKLDSTN